MSELKRPLGIDVLTAARQRIAYVFDHFDAVYVSFSGGKDSTALLHLTMDEAIRRGRKVGLLFIDWEAQYRLTIEHVRAMFELYSDHVEPYWVALPLKTVNAVSMIEPEWICWDPEKRDLWVRKPPEDAITDPDFFDFYTYAMTFEEFVPEFGRWYSRQHGPGVGALTAAMVGIRADESLNRFRAVAKERASMFEGRPWTTWIGGSATYNVYPIYDWRTEDVWTYLAKEGKPYNALYDRMHAAGLSVHQMRICEPYGDEQRKGLWLFHVTEPETWGRVCARVAGANSGALYANETGSIMGNVRITKPEGMTWESYARFLLDTMPPPTAEHYRNKIAVYIQYCRTHFPQYQNGIPDEAHGDTGSKDIPSWRRICKVLLKNDYWCKGLSFSPTKSEAYERYKRIMKKRRAAWGII